MVVKSTLLPYELGGLLGNPRIVYNPEFLNARTANDDFKNQEVIFLGGFIESTKKVEELYKTVFNLNALPEYVHEDGDSIMLFKFLRNVKIAQDVLFLNMINEVVRTPKFSHYSFDFRKIQHYFSKLPTTPINKLVLSSDGKPGFGGACLPKDTTKLFDLTGNPLLESILKLNKRLKEKK